MRDKKIRSAVIMHVNNYTQERGKRVNVVFL